MVNNIIRKGLLLFALLTAGFGTGLAQAQTSVKGNVTSESTGEPLAGVAVVVSGTSIGAVTDQDGNYVLTVPDGRRELTASCLGFADETVAVGGRSIINFSLKESQDWLDGVVVVGYGVQKKKLTTGANLNVKSEDIMKRNTTGALQALQGQTPGMQISSNSGQPGEGMKVTIRGLGTTGSSGPLFIVDGVPGDISKINPSDIESIDVLKDAASAAIYGAQAANGVVLVTTKSGHSGDGHLYYNGYYGVQTVARYMPMLNAEQYKTIMDEQALNSGNGLYDWGSYDIAGVDTDWIRQMFRDAAPTQNHTVGISGGTDASVYAISFNYSDQQGIVGNKDHSDFESYKFRVNTEHTLYNGLLKVGEHASFIHNNTVGVGVGNQYNNTLRGAFNTSPLAPVYGNNYYGLGDSNGLWNDSSYAGVNSWYNGDGNPYASMLTGSSISKSQNVTGDVYAELNPFKGFKVRSTFGLNFYASRGHSFTPPSKWNVYGVTPSSETDYYASVSQSESNGFSISWINTVSYDFTVADDHNFNTMVGSEWDTNEGEWMYGNNKIAVEQFKDFEHAWLNNGSDSNSYWSKPQGGVNDVEKTLSFFARLGYNYKEKYMVNATFRADGSSKFASGHRWGFFPSVSAGWVVSEEDFLKGSDFLSFLKLRGSWGQVGNKNITSFAYAAPIATSNHSYNFGTEMGSAAEQIGAVQTRLSNPDIKWETSEQLDFGFDARFFNSRMSMNFDWYRKMTKDWLVTAPVVATAGADAPYINGGSVVNSGVELSLGWNDSIGEFNYYLNANGAFNRNIVGEIPNSDGIIHGNTNELFDNAKEFYRAENGHAIGYWWGLQTNGIFQNREEINEWIAAGNGVLQKDVQPGDVRFIDQNGDGVINDSDKIDLGNGMAKFSYGFSLGFDWKGLDFNMTAFGVAGNKLVQSYRGITNTRANYTTAILQRWTGEGTSNRVPRVTDSNVNYTEFSDLFLQDGSFLRISDITVGYDFSRLANVNWLAKCRLYFSCQNALTFTKYDGMDPEIGYGTSGWCSGIDVGYYPHPRIYLLGVNLTF